MDEDNRLAFQQRFVQRLLARRPQDRGHYEERLRRAAPIAEGTGAFEAMPVTAPQIAFETIVRREISGNRRKRSPKGPRTSDDRDAAVVGDVEPFVAVGGPRVRSVQALDENGAAPVGERPQTERTIDVEPTVARRHPIGDLVERVEGAGS